MRLHSTVSQLTDVGQWCRFYPIPLPYPPLKKGIMQAKTFFVQNCLQASCMYFVFTLPWKVAHSVGCFSLLWMGKDLSEQGVFSRNNAAPNHAHPWRNHGRKELFVSKEREWVRKSQGRGVTLVYLASLVSWPTQTDVTGLTVRFSFFWVGTGICSSFN